MRAGLPKTSNLMDGMIHSHCNGAMRTAGRRACNSSQSIRSSS
jgi:hypothetical protein